MERARVEQPLDALAHRPPARGVLARHPLLAAHLARERLAPAQLLELGLPAHAAVASQGCGRTGRAGRRARPPSTCDRASRAELAEAVARGRAVRVAGAGHSFSGGVPTDGTLLSLERLDRVLDVDRASGLVRAEAGIGLHRLVRELARARPRAPEPRRHRRAVARRRARHRHARDGREARQPRLGRRGDGARARRRLGAARSTAATSCAPRASGSARSGSSRRSRCAACRPSASTPSTAPLPLEEVLDSLDEHVDGNDHFELFTFPHSPLALTRTNNRTDAPPTPRRPRLEWLQDVVLDNHAFGLAQPRGAARPAGDPAPSTGWPARAASQARAGGGVLRRVRQPAARALRGDGVRAAAGARGRGGAGGARDPRAPPGLVPDRAALLGRRRRAALARARARQRVRRRPRVRGHGRSRRRSARSRR